MSSRPRTWTQSSGPDGASEQVDESGQRGLEQDGLCGDGAANIGWDSEREVDSERARVREREQLILHCGPSARRVGEYDGQRNRGDKTHVDERSRSRTEMDKEEGTDRGRGRG